METQIWAVWLRSARPNVPVEKPHLFLPWCNYNLRRNFPVLRIFITFEFELNWNGEQKRTTDSPVSVLFYPCEWLYTCRLEKSERELRGEVYLVLIDGSTDSHCPFCFHPSVSETRKLIPAHIWIVILYSLMRPLESRENWHNCPAHVWSAFQRDRRQRKKKKTPTCCTTKCSLNVQLIWTIIVKSSCLSVSLLLLSKNNCFKDGLCKEDGIGMWGQHFCPKPATS